MMRRVQRTDKLIISAVAETIADKDSRDDMAIPSYLHPNPLIQWLFWRRLDAVYSCFERPHYDTILDFGCGVGTLLPSLGTIADKVIGCDKRTEPARQFVQKLQIPANVQIIDPEKLNDIPDDSIDAIVAADVLEHVDDLNTLIARFTQLLRPGAEFIVSGPTENWLYSLGRKIAGFTGDYHVRDISDIDSAIRAGGFVKTSCKRLPFGMLPSTFALFEILHYRKS